MMQIDLVETERLKGERISRSHWQQWLQIGFSPAVMATMGGVWDLEKAEHNMQVNCEEWKNNGHGQWIFFDKSTKEFVGRGGIRKVTVNKNQEVELGYALMPKFWGKGLAVEIGKKTLTIAFNCFNYKNVVCYTLVDNQKSQRVMQKIGFTFEENIFHANLPHVLYRYQNPNYQLRKH
jgi:[ribosomal protein S5]-alanine N-acetyltransferase